MAKTIYALTCTTQEPGRCTSQRPAGTYGSVEEATAAAQGLFVLAAGAKQVVIDRLDDE